MADTRLNPDQVDFASAIAEMRNEKMTDDEIHKEIASEFGTTIADQHLQRGVFAPKKEEPGIWPKEWERIPNEVPWEIPAAVAATGAAISAVKSDKGQQIIQSIKDRMFGPSQPTMPGEALNGAAVVDGAPPSPAIAQVQTPEQIRIQKQQAAQAMIEGRPVVSGAGPVTQSVANDAAASAAQQIANAVPAQYPEGVTPTTEVGNRPKDMQLVERSEYNKQANQINADQAKLAKQGAVSPKKSKAIPSYKTEANIPEGMVFRPDVGNLDRSLVNILGPEGRLYAKDVLNEGKMFGHHQGADYNKKVQELVGAYGEELKKITPSIDLTTREGRIAAGVPHTSNYGSALGKAAKVGGVLGTLMTIAQSANAKEAARNVGESLLPLAITPSEIQSGTLTAKQLKAFEESKKLGSPYRSVPPSR